jgi:hypothetical protein
MRRPAAILALAVGAWCAAGWVTQPDVERSVKAACLYNFTKFVTWPDVAWGDPEAPVVIGLIGDDPFGPALDNAVRGKQAHGRPVEVVRLGPLKEEEPVPRQRLRQCHILFVALAEQARAPEVRAAVRDAPVLTVSDIPEFAVEGGVIELAVEQGQVRCRVNREAARRHGLELSAKLLRLSQIVRERGGESH